MPRPRRLRRIGAEPRFCYFRPVAVPLDRLKDAILTIDEIEAVRLKDFKGMDQVEAAKKMNISQPTFNRLIKSARKKIADAIVNGKAIKIEGGPCKIPGKTPIMECICPLCGNTQPKELGVPAREILCKVCGSPMVREK